MSKIPKVAGRISRFKEHEVKELFKKAKRVLKHPGLDILCAPSEKKEFGRILVITSKKTGIAAKRNRIRRRLKSIFYNKKLYEKKIDCIIIIKKDGINLSFEQLEDLLKCLD